MKLFHRKFGQGPSFIIMHGLYGSSDNWVTVARTLSSHFEVWLPDLRNHGRSPHSQEHNYRLMAEDLLEFMNEHSIEKSIVLGHSMGGKAAMRFAYLYPERLSHLIVLDIAPKSYMFSINQTSDALNHKSILETMLNFDFSGMSSREFVEQKLSESIQNMEIRQFLLKNVKRRIDNTFGWIINVPALHANLYHILDGFTGENNSLGDPIISFPVLFMKGGNSDYIELDDLELIRRIFPYSDFVTIPDAGHWLHVEKPDLIIKEIFNFLDLSQ
jgi:pimeloyl-ACP methyl ester carboxylesterase